MIESLIESGGEPRRYTDVDRDGMLEGPDLESFRELAEPLPARVIYSGGIGSLEDLAGLVALSLASLDGVIVGKALRERRFDRSEAIGALAG